MNEAQYKPYRTLGQHLQYLREQQKESLAEVSGAVEIDEQELARIEAGHERPAEEVLLLLISHFNMQDQEAVQLWELAGYDGTDNGPSKAEDIAHEILSNKPVIVVVGIDGRTMYTDAVQVQTNDGGIVMNFGQLNSKNQAQPIARLGMSHAQAQEVLNQLQRALLQARYQKGPKALPPTTDSNSEVV
jgi:transcriptional regulator with XRE-family HTH domain